MRKPPAWFQTTTNKKALSIKCSQKKWVTDSWFGAKHTWYEDVKHIGEHPALT